MSSYTEAVALAENLPATGVLAWDIGKVYNALLVEAKREQPESISLKALDPVRSMTSVPVIDGVDAPSMRTLLAVVVAALEPGPAIG